jgi:hypothetical protein
MQIVSTTGSTAKAKTAKANGKRRARASSAPSETLHLRAKQLTSKPSSDELAGMIATAAYYCAERRHFAPGHELEDWLAAEREINTSLPM